MTKLPSSSFQTSKPSKPSSFRSLLSKPPSAASFLILILLLRRFLLGTTSPIHPGYPESVGITCKAPTPPGTVRAIIRPQRLMHFKRYFSWMLYKISNLATTLRSPLCCSTKILRNHKEIHWRPIWNQLEKYWCSSKKYVGTIRKSTEDPFLKSIWEVLVVYLKSNWKPQENPIEIH